MSKYKGLLVQLTVLLIITAPAIFALFKAPWFSIHDDQHIARLFLLDSALKQGYFYPRWVDTLGFGFGYPLFNFYPPFIYYISEIFHLLGFSLINSIKLMITTGYFLAAVGMYFFSKKYIGKAAGFVSAVFYTYFTYHAIVVYVRGALAEFFAMTILPFVFLSIHNVYKNPNKRNMVIFGGLLGLLILTHPLIALPTLFFIGFFILFYSFHHSKLVKSKEIPLVASGHTLGLKAVQKAGLILLGSLIALSLSTFFWLPSLIEKKFTLVDKILTHELANYKLHFVFPQQFWYSPWGYGGSTAGLADGMSFQLGKIHIGFGLLALILYLIYRFSNTIITPKKKLEMKERSSYFTLSFLCLLFSLFMSTSYSSFIWDNVSPLWFIQFPWRFHTFTAVFISLCCGYFIFLLTHLFNKLNTAKTLAILAIITSFLPILFYQKYFSPQRFINTSDTERTTYEDIAWRISRSSYDFVPKGVKTTKTELGTTVVDITKDKLPKSPYTILSGSSDVTVLKNNFNEKSFQINAASDTIFQLNTYYFPGWKAYLAPGLPGGDRIGSPGVAEINKEQLTISDSNPYKLITVNIPRGQYEVVFKFQNTPVRKLANSLTIGTIIIVLYAITKNLRRHFSKKD